MTVHAQHVGRADLMLHRDCDEKVGARWQENRFDGRGYVGKDLRAWSATYSMRLPDGTKVYSTDCSTTSDGYAIAKIPANAFTQDVWHARPCGTWRIDADGPNGERILLGWGNWTLDE